MQRTLPSLQNYLFPDCNDVQTNKAYGCYDHIIIKTSNAFFVVVAFLMFWEESLIRVTLSLYYSAHHCSISTLTFTDLKVQHRQMGVSLVPKFTL